MATGTDTIDFGSTGSVYVTKDVTTSGLTAASYIEAFKMAEASASNTVDAHIAAPIRLTCEYLTATTFRVHAVSDWTLRGVYNIRWVTA